jgi:hypothetical protein
MRDIMPIDAIPDWDKRLARQDAFWNCEVVDRAFVTVTAPKEKPERPWPAQKSYASLTDRWFDVERHVEIAQAAAANTEYAGDALPATFPNLGPDVFAAWLGADLNFSEETSWTNHPLEDWSQADQFRFSRDKVYWKKMVELTAALLEGGQGLYYTGITDLHPGGDALAALRGPIQLNYDLVTEPEPVKQYIDYVTDVYFEVYDFYYDWLSGEGQACTTWPGITTTKKYYVPSNDFSCMVGPAMFDEFFLPGLRRECQHMEASIYHLDGPGALCHLDSLLSIDELNAIQWVWGAGNGSALDWIEVFQKVQNAGRAVQIHANPGEVEPLMEALRPEGVHLHVSPMQSASEARDLVKLVEKWS